MVVLHIIVLVDVTDAAVWTDRGESIEDDTTPEATVFSGDLKSEAVST
jgi:hypothetical protein|tara:strand:+ start:26145 stop:26288 length:144 start_codon:yes stop_codon:yes gene_type:complete